MDVEFRDPTLALIETDRAAETRLPVAAIRSARHKLKLVRAAPDEFTLRHWRSLDYQRVGGEDGREGSIGINGKWKLLFKINDQCTPNKIVITKLEDLH